MPERTRCYGICPAYRLSPTRSGAVHFRSSNPGDSARLVDYLGCHPGVEPLRRFEQAVDGTARSERWVRNVGFQQAL